MTAEHSVNTSLAYCVLRRNGAMQRISFAAPVRGSHLQLGTCDDAVLSNLQELGLCHADPIRTIESLPIPGLRVTQEQQFTCPLFRPPAAPVPALLPRESLADLRVLRTRLLPHSDGGREWSLGQEPTEFGAVPIGTDYIWVQELVTDVWWPYVVPQFVVEAVLRLSLFPDVAEISEPAHRMLTDLFYVHVPEQVQGLKTPGLTDLRIPPLQLAALVSYYAELRESGAMRLGDRDSSNRAWMNDERLSKVLLRQYSGYISKLTGVRLSPYFSHFVSYLPKSTLPMHLDKDPGVFSVSIQLGYFDNRFVSKNTWGFCVADAQSDSVRLFMPEIGQGVVFRGGHEKHSRDEIPDGHTSDVLLFHYAST